MYTPSSPRPPNAILVFIAAFVYVWGLLISLAWNSILLNVMRDLSLNDLGKFYYDARAFLLDQPMYEPSPATLIPVTETTSLQFLNLNPPHFHLALLPVASLGHEAVLWIWLVTGLAALTLSLCATFRELGALPSNRIMLLGLLFLISSAAFGSILTTGQLTLHLLPFVTWAWIAARRHRWMQVGIALGVAISIKSFLLILLPWLAIRGRAMPVVVSLIVVAAAFVSGVLVFGIDAWHGWLSAVGAIDWYGLPLDASLRSFAARVFDHTPNYEPVIHAPDAVLPIWGVGSVLIGMTSLGLAIFDRSPEATDRTFTLLILAALLMAPLGWIYYVLLALPSAIGLLSTRAREEPRRTGATLLRRSRNAAGIVGGCLLLIPTVAAAAMSASVMHTLTIGSAHFWAVGSLWWAVVLDGVLARGPVGPRLEASVSTPVPRSAL